MLLFVIVAIFVAGLMVGRTPEYVGKKTRGEGSQDGDARHADPAAVDARLHGRGAVIPSAVASTANAGPHGFSEILYAYTSQTGNNGSAFAGLTGNTLWYNITGGVAMLIGRFFIIIPAMAIAGSLVAKKSRAAFQRHVPDPWRPVRRPAGRRDPHRRRPDLLPRARARAHRRASRDAAGTLF